MRTAKNATTSTTPHGPGRAGWRGLIRAEWPIVLYPVLVAAALLLVYVVNRPGSPHGGATPTGSARPAKSPALADAVTTEQPARVSSTDPNARTKENTPAA